MKKLAPSSLADIAKEIATDADKFTISFPQDLKVTRQDVSGMPCPCLQCVILRTAIKGAALRVAFFFSVVS